MYDHPLTIEKILNQLAATPVRIAELTNGLSPAILQTAPQPDEWSARDVLAHLRACSDMWGKYIILILNQDHPTFKAVNPTTWIKQTDYLEQEFQASLQTFTSQRDSLLAVLSPLPPEAWTRTVTVTGAGRPIERSAHTYAQWLANHERTHIRQIEKIVNTLDKSI